MTQTEMFQCMRVGEYTRENPVCPYAQGSETSREAACRKDSSAHVDRERIYSFLLARGPFGATRQEIENGLGMSGDSVRPRVKELLGEIGRYREVRICRADFTRETESGRRAVVLVAMR